MVIILLILAVIFDVISDWSSENKFKSAYWNKSEGWRFKYKGWFKEGNMWINKEKPGKHWYYLGLFKTDYPEKFPFSTTSLVFLTDGWHLMQWCYNRCWQGALTLALDMPHPWVIYAFIGIGYGMLFELISSRK